MAEPESNIKLTLEQRVAALDRYPGNLTDYNELKGEKYEQIELKGSLKYVLVDQNRNYSLLKELLDQGCVGVIYYVPRQASFVNAFSSMYIGGYGIPVKKILVLEGRAVDK